MFEKAILEIKQQLSLDLPGEAFQQLMAPRFRQSTSHYLKSKPNPKVACVMILLYEGAAGEMNTVLIKRQENTGVHSAQISFPGGKMDESDVSKEAAALRETHEEIGIDPNKITIIGNLSQLYIPVSNFLVHPVVGYTIAPLSFTLQANEVAGIIETPVAHFLKESNRSEKQLDTSYGTQIEAPYYDVFGNHVWGATAMILSEFSAVLKRLED